MPRSRVSGLNRVGARGFILFTRPKLRSEAWPLAHAQREAQVGSPVRTMASLDPDEIEQLATETAQPKSPEKDDGLPKHDQAGLASGKEAGRGK